MTSTLTITLIVRNEEATLGRCLDSVRGLADEIVVVDTGSTDGTREIAASYGARLVDFAWCDDFAAARNESLRQATGRWVLWLDADEYFDDRNRAKVKALLSECSVFSVQCSAGADDRPLKTEHWPLKTGKTKGTFTNGTAVDWAASRVVVVSTSTPRAMGKTDTGQIPRLRRRIWRLGTQTKAQGVAASQKRPTILHRCLVPRPIQHRFVQR
jgi:glycosyltransferase involved in cell wall biosynthesis